jgi:predicted DNA-binding transcriptional regulator AlpA
MNAAGPPLLLAEKEAAKILGFSERTLQKWRNLGGGPLFVRVSARAVRYRQVDLDNWIEARLRTPTSDPGNAVQ